MSDLLITDGEPLAPAPGAEVLSITVDNSLRDKGDGAFKIEVDDFADDKDDAQDVVIQDGGDIQSLEIAKIGKGDGEDDVFRLDLATFDDDFELTIKSEEANDKIILEGATDASVNSDGTYTITYLGDDGLQHQVVVDPGKAQIEIYGDITPPEPETEEVAEGATFVVDADLSVTCPGGGVEEFCSFKDSDGKPVTISFSYDFGTGISQDIAGEKHEILTAAQQPDGAIWDEVYLVVKDKDGQVQFAETVQRGDVFEVQGTKGDGTFESETFFEIYDFEGGPLLQEINVHTSCSDPTSTQDRFGSITIESATLENGRVLNGAVTLSEPDIIYSLEGVDADLFDIDADTGVVTFKEAPDFENPQDSGGDNLYDVTIVATAKADPACVTREPLIVEVTDENEICIAENTNPPVDTSIVVDCPQFDETPTAICAFKSQGDKPATIQFVYDFGTGINQVVEGEKHEILTPAQLPDGAAWDEVFLVVRDKNGVEQFAGVVQRGQAFEVSGTKSDGSFESETFFEIYDFQGGPLLQEINVHTSCSDPTHTTDQFGSVTIAGATLQSGMVLGGFTNVTLSGAELAYTLTGPDAHLFQVDANGTVSFIAPPDFETPLDADMNNEYVVTVRGANPDDPCCFEEETIIICVEDVAEAPTIIGRVFVDTNEDGLELSRETVVTPQPDEMRALSIANASFESSALDDGDWDSGISGWTISANGYAGEWDPTASEIPGGPTDGENVAWIERAGTTISQTLAETYDDAATYSLEIDVSDSALYGSQNFTIRLLAGATVVASATGATAGDAFSTVALATTPGGHAGLSGQPLRIEITNNSNGELFVDNVRGAVVTPQPDLVEIVETVEPPFANATVVLLDAISAVVTDAAGAPITTTTDENGEYVITGMPAGDYRIQVIEPTDFDFTIQDAGLDDTIDSDADQATGVTAVISVGAEQTVSDVDVGLVVNPEDPPVAIDDAITIGENDIIGFVQPGSVATTELNVFDDNGLGADFDPDGQAISLVSAGGVGVGQIFTVTTDPSPFIAPVDVRVAVTAAGDVILDTREPNLVTFRSLFEDLAEGEFATLSFDYVIEDTTGLTDTATVTVTILGEDSPPNAIDDAITIGENDIIGFVQPGSVATAELNVFDDNGFGADFDPDGQAISLVSAGGVAIGQVFTVTTDPSPFIAPVEVRVAVTAAGDVILDTREPNLVTFKSLFEDLAPGEFATLSFDYVIEDTTGLTDTATVTVTILGENSPPDAIDDFFVVAEGAGLTDSNVVTDANPDPDATPDDDGEEFPRDSDPEGDPLTVVAVDGESLAVGETEKQVTVVSDGGRTALVTISDAGDISVDQMGNFDDLNLGESDELNLTYTISDGVGGEDTANINIKVNGLGQPEPDVEYNVVFLVDTSSSTGVGIEDGHPLFRGADGMGGGANGLDDNLDGNAISGTVLDAEIATVKAMVETFGGLLPDDDVDFGVFTFGTSVFDTADAPEVVGAVDEDGAFNAAAFNGLTTGGVAAFNTALAAANTFLADQNVNGDPAAEQVNLVYLLTDQLGLDTGDFVIQDDVNIVNELKELVEDNGGLIDTVVFKEASSLFDPTNGVQPIEVIESSIEYDDVDATGAPITRTIQTGDGQTNEILSLNQLSDFLGTLDDDVFLV